MCPVMKDEKKNIEILKYDIKNLIYNMYEQEGNRNTDIQLRKKI